MRDLWPQISIADGQFCSIAARHELSKRRQDDIQKACLTNSNMLHSHNVGWAVLNTMRLSCIRICPLSIQAGKKEKKKKKATVRSSTSAQAEETLVVFLSATCLPVSQQQHLSSDLIQEAHSEMPCFECQLLAVFEHEGKNLFKPQSESPRGFEH